MLHLFSKVLSFLEYFEFLEKIQVGANWLLTRRAGLYHTIFRWGGDGLCLRPAADLAAMDSSVCISVRLSG